MRNNPMIERYAMPPRHSILPRERFFDPVLCPKGLRNRPEWNPGRNPFGVDASPSRYPG